MRSSLDVAMVVFKCLLSLLVVVFFIPENHCKPAYDEPSKDNGIWTSFWGWVTYINPWGSDDNTSESSLISEQHISTPTNKGSIAEARLLTAATIHVNPTTAVKPVSKQSLELQATIPIMLAPTRKTTKNPTTEHFMKSDASTAAITSAKMNLITSEISAIEPNAREFEPNASTIPIPTNEDILKTTQVTESEHYLEVDVSTTPIALNQDILTTTEEFVSTTLIVPFKENPTITEEPSTENYLDIEMSTSFLTPLLDQDIFTTTNEPVAEEPLDLEDSTIVSHSPSPTTTEESTTEQPLESEPIEPTIEYQPPMKPRTSSISKCMDQNNNEGPLEVEVPIISEISDLIEPNASTIPVLADDDILKTTQVTKSEHYLEVDVSTTPIALNLDIRTTTEEFVSTTLIVPFKENPITTEEPSTENYLDLEISTSLLTPLLDQDIFTTTNEPVAEEPLDLEDSTIVSHSPSPTTTEESTAEQPLEPEPIEPAIEYQPPMKPRTSTISKCMYQNNNEGPLEVEVPIISEISDLIEPIQVSYPEVGVAVTERNKVLTEENQVLILTDIAADSYSEEKVYVTGRDEMPTEENEILILSVSTDQYPEIEAELAGNKSRDATDNTNVNKESILTEPVSDLYSVVNVSVLGRDEVSTEESETTILTESTTIFYPGVEVAVTQRGKGLTVKHEKSNQNEPATESVEIDEMFILTDSTPELSTAKDTSVLIEHSTNPLLEGNSAWYKLMYGVPTKVGVDAMFTAVDGVSTGIDAVSSEVDSVFTAVDAGSTGVHRTVLTKVDRAIATPRVRLPKSSATYNAGFQFSFDYRIILLCHTIYLVCFSV